MSTSELLSAAPAAAVGDTPPASAPPAAGTPPAGPPWLTGADETTVGYVQNKGWADPKDVITAYKNAEKFISAPVDKRLVLPNDNQDPKAWDAVFDKLGRPADAAGYKIEVPAGGDAEFAKQAGGWFHELGLTQKQGEALAAKWNEHIGGMGTAAATAQASAFAADDAALKTAWGSAFAQNVAQAQVGMRAVGGPEMVDKLSAAMGHKATMEFLQNIGSRTGEASFESGQTAVKFGNAMTPAQAKARIAEIRGDKALVAKYINKDADVVAEMKRLHEFAFPESKD